MDRTLPPTGRYSAVFTSDRFRSRGYVIIFNEAVGAFEPYVLPDEKVASFPRSGELEVEGYEILSVSGLIWCKARPYEKRKSDRRPYDHFEFSIDLPS